MTTTAPLRPIGRVALAAALLAAACGAQAHQIWFERDGRALTFRYGELDVNMHEVSPGGLDRFVELKGTLVSAAGARPLVMSKAADAFVLPELKEAPGAGTTVTAIDLQYPMFDTKRDGKALRTYWVPATRWVADLKARAASLPLDIVPTGVEQGGRAEFQVVYKGDPLPGAKMALVTPAGWTLNATSDADGKFRFPLPWKGNYVIGLYYVDDVTGERVGPAGKEAYQLEGYNSALSFQRAQGLAPLPVAEKTLPASVLADMAKAKAAAAGQK
ncbi:hypothetical protein CDN99_25205 [Roseateles aquatilis]|uniref:DUF4198 domain-containing protein n=2 Tax=Roseateles aquatilis TaxID=431061 RepID=A0A246IUE6_9BURK|nr:hypothetical protein CDN99_25205 [Roseateles aquatilis]